MKRKIVLCSLWIMLMLAACGLPVRYTEVRGSGSVVTQERPISTFNAIDLSGIGTVMIEQGTEETLEITAEDNLIDYLVSDVKGRQLYLGMEEFINLQPSQDIIFYVMVKDINTIKTSGMGKVIVKNGLESDNLQLEISGSGNMDLADLSVRTLAISISGMGDVTVSGNAMQQNIEISGTGNYHAADLFSRSAQVQISGSGNARVWAADDLDLVLSGMGNLEYFGDPILTTEISGMGDVTSLGNK